jgi:hypothetical protein
MAKVEKTAKREAPQQAAKDAKTVVSSNSENGQAAPSMYVHDDWTLFRNVTTLGQKAGVATGDLPRLIAKELVDNGLDAAGACTVGLLPDGGLYVEDEGPGIAGGAEGVAGLFCVRRPLLSSKLIRLPTRGCLGNGTRVVGGAVLATGGRMFVATRGARYRLDFLDDGSTTAKRTGAYAKQGTRIEIWLGKGDDWPAGGFNDKALQLAKWAIAFAGHGRTYAGNTSAYWYDSDSFFELLQAADARTVRELVTDFEGCSRAGLSGKRGRACSELSRKEADKLLSALRDASAEVKPARLGQVGKVDGFPRGYAKMTDTLIVKSHGSLPALVPFLAEAWARPAKGDDDSFHLLVNRTRTVACLGLYHEKTELYLSGCGLSHEFKVGRAPVEIWVNITAPHVPLINDGKTPDLGAMEVQLREVIEKSASCARRIYGSGGGRSESQKARIEASLDEAIKQASGDGRFEFSIRQLFYVVRPMVADGNDELLYDNFTRVVGEHEKEHGPLPGMYRDPRGVLYHPHLHELISLGTRAVDEYKRPEWTFNKILYCEKEGIVSILCQDHWPERNDCALLSAKGQASRAVKDVLDLLGETDEELLFFCVHDGDAAGTVIFQALQEETAARPARKVKILNLGLEPWEGIAMGLPVEPAEYKARQAVADYVRDRDDGKNWPEWLQSNRIELNAMTTPQFIAWLDGKMAEHGQGRLVPPAEVLAEHLEQQVRAQVVDTVRDSILREHDFEGRVQAECSRLAPSLQREAARLPEVVRSTLAEPEYAPLSWAAVVDDVAVKMTRAGRKGDSI